jgi:hypothetical protein
LYTLNHYDLIHIGPHLASWTEMVQNLVAQPQVTARIAKCQLLGSKRSKHATIQASPDIDRKFVYGRKGGLKGYPELSARVRRLRSVLDQWHRFKGGPV